MQVYIPFSLNKKLKEQTRGFKFKAFCFLFEPFNETFWNVIFVCHVKTERFMNIYL